LGIQGKGRVGCCRWEGKVKLMASIQHDLYHGNNSMASMLIFGTNVSSVVSCLNIFAAMCEVPWWSNQPRDMGEVGSNKNGQKMM
jgi:hypothetical protein